MSPIAWVILVVITLIVPLSHFLWRREPSSEFLWGVPQLLWRVGAAAGLLFWMGIGWTLMLWLTVAKAVDLLALSGPALLTPGWFAVVVGLTLEMTLLLGFWYVWRIGREPLDRQPAIWSRLPMRALRGSPLGILELIPITVAYIRECRQARG